MKSDDLSNKTRKDLRTDHNAGRLISRDPVAIERL